MAFVNILPDPINTIGYAGRAGSFTGPGLAGVTVSSMRGSNTSRALRSNTFTTYKEGQYWKFSLEYNPLTRTNFEPVYSFIMSRIGQKTPFYVQLPEFTSPRDATLNSNVHPLRVLSSFLEDGTTAISSYSAGSDYIIIGNPQKVGVPSQGDYCTITDHTDTNHTKVYKVAYVQTTSSTIKAPYNQGTDTFFLKNHGLTNNKKLYTTAVTGSGTTIATINTNYWVTVINEDRFQVSLTLGGAAVNFSAGGTATFQTEPYLQATQVKVYLTSPLVRTINTTGTHNVNAVANAAGNYFTLANHGLQTGDLVLLNSATLAPFTVTAPFATNFMYYAIFDTTSRFKLAATYADAIANNRLDILGDDGVSYNFTFRPPIVNFHNVKAYCTAENITEYALDEDYLFKFGLELKEFQA
jgi:hypothetical protein